jgi:glycosyltransferase involved in cell wall biosynthesis
VAELSFLKDIHLVYRGHAWQPAYILKSLFGAYPLVMSTYNLQAMREVITEQLSTKKIDCIHIEPGYVWPSIPKTNVPLVVGEHNIEHRVYQEYVEHYPYPFIKTVMQRDVEKMKRWERSIWETASHIITVSDEDAQVIKAIKKNVTVVHNGIDEETFIFKPKNNLSDRFTCLFVGNFRWMQNVDAVKFLLSTVWPSVVTAYPKARLHIVGREFPKKLVSALPDSVSLIPHVEEITDEFNTVDLVLAPIRIGGGTKYKVLEAMAAGVPVITTSKGTQGLPLEDRVHCYIADKVSEWSGNIQYIINHPDVNKKIVKNARNLVEKEYSWNIVSKELSRVWKLYA